MQRNYTFERTTVDGTEYVIATPCGEGEMVRMEVEWMEGELEGDWERAVRAVLDAELFGAMTVGSGEARVDRSTAVAVLVEASTDSSSNRLDHVTREAHADALVAYLDFADVWTVDVGDVVVLRDPRDGALSRRETVAWAVALDVCVDRLDKFIEDVDGPTGDSVGNETVTAKLSSVRGGFETKAKEIRAQAIQHGEFPVHGTEFTDCFEELVMELSTDDLSTVGETIDDVVPEPAGVGDVSENVENTTRDDPVRIVENLSAVLAELGEQDGIEAFVEQEPDTSTSKPDQ
ncbi:hypothetical protein [Halorubellus litoreus]|uniref:Halobacterial output domain-containing protein n=1 Tax=Halorubellus litoreus TaxID=755308 RepID=A0ABD5VI39_9EURY